MQSIRQDIGIGIDVGGSGIKGAPVDLHTGNFLREQTLIPTPPNGSPAELAAIIKEVADSFSMPADVPVGVSFPAPVINGKIPMMVNLSQEWLGMNVTEFLCLELGKPVAVLNDADSAGYGEVHYGAAQGGQGTVLMLTLGTGIGSALVRDGILVPNTELGHIFLDDGTEAEPYAASSVFAREGWTFAQWAERLQRVFSYLEMLLAPDLFIVGGGVSQNHDKFLPLLHTRARIVPAKLRNRAGIAGAALFAAEKAEEQK